MRTMKHHTSTQKSPAKKQPCRKCPHHFQDQQHLWDSEVLCRFLLTPCSSLQMIIQERTLTKSERSEPVCVWTYMAFVVGIKPDEFELFNY